MFKKVLVLAPHTDDGEFGCGGFMTRLVEQGAEVCYAAFSSAEKSLPFGVHPDTLKNELNDALDSLGITVKNRFVYDYSVRDFPEHRQELLEDMVALKEKIGPNLVLMPCFNDTHQDHLTIAQEGFRAFKDRTILGYEIPWNNKTFNTESFVLLDEKHIQAKVKALKCYKSQLDRFYATEEFIRALAKTRGTQIGTAFAEAFEVIRWVIR
ncbi:MAG: PIG-L family deacetylase [Candidatus Edwardsbacteria bacterium]|nr:PIG-L family deacetylase [Candidatus Edwardsbacteria bacterium]MBU1577017.1 PIG-L family deacetylase [Candidatus Edwardsbacteria bacterium]MBU2464565.1 PIG-L family deacetylase [Candidatus Edwardsbacteria bacterium]MBU2593428.1 PIG-L family deacetylase [Candidatus Edwardsbacteria bacterium]